MNKRTVWKPVTNRFQRKKYGEVTPLKVAPEICIEILSPSNSNTEIVDKIDLYLAKGAKEVWIVDESGKIVGVGKAGYGSEKVETEKQSEKQKPIVHYDYLYLEHKNI